MISATHLAEGYRQRARRPDSERIAWIRQDRWLGFPKAEAVRATLKAMFTYPARTRMPCLLIFGQTGMGKTRIVERFEMENPAASMTGLASPPSRWSRCNCHHSRPKGSFTGSCSKLWAPVTLARLPGRKAALKSAARAILPAGL